MANTRAFPIGQEWLTELIQLFGYPANCQDGLCEGFSKWARGQILIDSNEQIFFHKGLERLYHLAQLHKEIKDKKNDEQKRMIAELSKNQRNYFLPFFDTMVLQHKWYVYPHLFADKQNAKNLQKQISYLTDSWDLVDKGGASAVGRFSAPYSQQQLFTCFALLQSHFKTMNTPIAFEVSNAEHCITVGFYPNNEQCPWVILNIEGMNENTSDANSISEKIYKLLAKGNLALCYFRLFILHKEYNAALEAFNLLQQDTNWQQIHKPAITNVNAGDALGNSWLALAVVHKDDELMQELVNQGADVNKVSKIDTISPLYLAAMKGNIQAVKSLLEKGVNVHQQSMLNKSYANHLVEKLGITAGQERINLINGATALHMASSEGFSDIVTSLLLHLADPNAKREDGTTPLFLAAKNGHVVTAIILLAFGALPTLACNDGLTPLYVAAMEGHAQIVKLLLDADVHPELPFIPNRKTPLYTAAQNGHVECVKFLLKKNANPNAVGLANEMTPLLIAAHNGHLDIVKLLLDAGADFKATWKGSSSEVLAMKKGHETVATLICKYQNSHVQVEHSASSVTLK